MTANLDKPELPPLPEMWMVDWIASKTGQHYWQWNTSQLGAKVCADQLADAVPPMIGRITRLYPHPDPTRSALVEALKEGRRAIGTHHAPHDCYATGPMTGDEYRDLVECPACAFISKYNAALLAAGEGL